MELYEKYKTLLNSYYINTPLRLAHFFSQLDHESNLKPIAENLNYSASGLGKTFKKYFPTIEIANKFARQPEKIANKVYANRMGNGNEASGDGFRFRGRGFIQITGKSNYTVLSKDTRIDFLTNPDLLLQEANALISALWFWQKNKLNEYADKDDIITITKRINGGLNGIEDRKLKLIKWKAKIK
jgi:putative chitinase